MNKKILTILFLLPIIFLDANAQKKNTSFNAEKIDIHIAGEDFVAGEEVWIQIYCLDHQAESFTDLSNFAYIEIISPWGYSVVRKKVILKDGVGSNVLNLPDTLTGGNYRLIAYTNWMKNFDYNDFYSEDIHVYNPEKSNGFKQSEDDKKAASLNFFYTLAQNELVDELSSVVFLKTEGFSKDDSVKLILYEKSEQYSIDSFPVKKKYGRFTFTPEKGKQYAIKLSGSGNEIVKDLPEVRENGINLTINKISKDNVGILFQSNPSQNIQINRYIMKSEGSKEPLASFPVFGRQEIEISTDKLTSGYSKIYLEDDKGNIVTTKSIYLPVQNHNIEFNNLREVYSTKSAVELQFAIPEKIRNLNSVVSVSARRTPKLRNRKTKEESGFHSINNALRFSSQKYYNPNAEKYFAPEKDRAFLNGIVNTIDESSTKRNPVTLSFVDSVSRIKKDYTDENNRFKFQIHPYKPDVDIVLNVPENSDRIRNIEITNNFISDFEFFTPNQTHSEKSDKDFIKELYLTQRIYETYELSNVQSIKSGNNTHVKRWISNSFYGIPDEIVRFDEYVLLSSLREYFRELITWARITRSNKQYSLSVIDKETGGPFTGDPAILLDGVLYNDIDSLMDIEPHLCEKVEIIRSPVLILDKLYYGLFALYTKKADLDDIELPESATRVAFPLYSKNVEFYVPEKQDAYPDFRNTLFWKSNVNLKDENESFTIQFETPKNEGSYELKIKGYTEKGDLIEQKASFEVKNP